MDNRLKAIIEYIDSEIGIVDVGTDHGFIPIELAERGFKGNIIATDINDKPLSNAKTNAKNKCVNSINFLKTDGLQGIDPKSIDTIIIAGMGGDLICDIIDKAEWTMDGKYHLILQPMTKIEILRFWLVNNGYNILEEKHVNKYTVLSVRFSGLNEVYSDGEIFVGKNPTPKLIESKLKSLSKIPDSHFYKNIIEELKYDNHKGNI